MEKPGEDSRRPEDRTRNGSPRGMTRSTPGQVAATAARQGWASRRTVPPRAFTRGANLRNIRVSPNPCS